MDFYASKEWKEACMGSPGGDAALQWMLEQADLKTGSKLLDLCCGAGKSSLYLAQKGYQVLGIDRATEAIQYAREQLESEKSVNCGFQEGDARALTLAEDSVEAVLCQCSLSLFGEEIPTVLKEIRRVLQVQGHLLLADLYWHQRDWEDWKKTLIKHGFVLQQWKDISKELQIYCAEYLWKTGEFFPTCSHGVGHEVRVDELGYYISVWRCM